MRRKADPLAMTSAAVCLLVLIVVGVVAPVVVSNKASVDQVCDLVVSIHEDRLERYAGTLDYLATPAGGEHTALNDYIRRVSLPQTRDEVKQERKNLPKACVAGRRLKPIPTP